MQTQNNNNRIPSPGNNSNLFERISYYISNIDKDWINRIKPASEEDISLLKKLSGIEEAGYDLPEDYKMFLKYMGQDDGGVFGKPLLGDISIENVIDLYKDIRAYDINDLNSNYLSFVSTEIGDQISFDLSQQDNPIVMTDLGKYTGFFSESFEKLLFQYAFIKYEREYYPQSIKFGGSKNMLNLALDKNQTKDIFEVVENYAKNYGFEKAWFSDKVHYIGIKEDATFYVDSRGGALAGIITGCNQEFLYEFGLKLASNIGVDLN